MTAFSVEIVIKIIWLRIGQNGFLPGPQIQTSFGIIWKFILWISFGKYYCGSSGDRDFILKESRNKKIAPRCRGVKVPFIYIIGDSKIWIDRNILKPSQIFSKTVKTWVVWKNQVRDATNPPDPLQKSKYWEPKIFHWNLNFWMFDFCGNPHDRILSFAWKNHAESV